MMKKNFLASTFLFILAWMAVSVISFVPTASLAQTQTAADKCPIRLEMSVVPDELRVWTDNITLTITVIRTTPYLSYCVEDQMVSVEFMVQETGQSLALKGIPFPRDEQGKGTTITKTVNFAFTPASIQQYDSNKTEYHFFARGNVKRQVGIQGAITKENLANSNVVTVKKDASAPSTQPTQPNQPTQSTQPIQPTETSRISNFKATTDPVAANATTYAKTVTWTYTAQANDPALGGFKLDCGLGNLVSVAKDKTEFKCSGYPRTPVKPYIISLTPYDNTSAKKDIGIPAQITISETTDGAGTADTNSTSAIVDLKKPLLSFNQPVSGDVQGLIQRIINVLFSLIASVAVLFIVIGGFRLAFSQGSPEAVTAGKKTIIWAIAGLVVALLTFAIIRAVIGLLY